MITEENDWQPFLHLFRREEINAKTVLLREGEISKRAFFIGKGCIRVWFNNNGSDVTFQFFFEGDGVSSIESFRTGQPSQFNVESIEPCILYSIGREDFQHVLDSSPAIRTQMEEIIFRRLLFYQQLFLSRIRDKPENRYRELLQHNPGILQRVPLHYIASYLGITAVSLSRIRGRKEFREKNAAKNS